MAAPNTPQRIVLWSVPRSVSSAFYRSMINRPNTKGIHEPYSDPYYMGPDKVNHRYDIMKPEFTYQSVTAMLEEPYKDFQTVFVKDMAYYIPQVFKNNMMEVLPKGYTHTFLIRNPKFTVPSLHKVSTDPQKTGWSYFDPREVGFKEILELFQEIQASTGTTPVIIDASDLIENPEGMLRAYCKAVNIEFYPSMLNWKDDVYATLAIEQWGDGWFSQIIATNTFNKEIHSKPKDTEDLPQVVQETIEENMPYYQELKKHCLKLTA